MSRGLKDWVDGYLFYTSNSEPRELFRRWTALSTIASCMQRKCRLDWGMETFYPNLFVVLVGPPASRKGTSIRPGEALLNQLGVPLAADESSRQKLIQALIASTANEPGEDGMPVFHASLTIISHELTVFLGYQNNELLSNLCDWYDCRDRFRYETIGRDVEEVPNVWVNLLGATTPMLLQLSLPEGAVGSGLTSRIVFCYEENKEKVVIVPTLTEDQLAIRDLLLDDLNQIRRLSGKFVASKGFMELYEPWRYESEARQIFTDPRLESYVERRQVHLLKLSMIYSASRDSDQVIEAEDFKRAIQTLELTEVKMPLVFQGVGTNPLAAVQLRLMRMLASKKSLSTEEIAVSFQNDANKTQMAEAIATLESMGYCRLNVKERKLVYTRGETL